MLQYLVERSPRPHACRKYTPPLFRFTRATNLLGGGTIFSREFFPFFFPFLRGVSYYYYYYTTTTTATYYHYHHYCRCCYDEVRDDNVATNNSRFPFGGRIRRDKVRIARAVVFHRCRAEFREDDPLYR